MAAAYAFGRRLMAEIEVQAVIGATLDAICAYGRADVAALYAAERADGDTARARGHAHGRPATLPGRLGEHGVAARAAAEQRALAVSYGATGAHAGGVRDRGAGRPRAARPARSPAGHTLAVLTMGRAADEPFGPERDRGRRAPRRAGRQRARPGARASPPRSGRPRSTPRSSTRRPTGSRSSGPAGEFVFANEAARRIAERPRHVARHELRRGHGAHRGSRRPTPTAYRAAAAERAEHPEPGGDARARARRLGPLVQDATRRRSRTSDGSLLGQIVIVRETTAEREGERLKSELLATVSHELRTPLTGVLGFAELLLRQDVDVDTRRQYLTTIHREARRLTALINDFLDLQRIEEGRLHARARHRRPHRDAAPLGRAVPRPERRRTRWS